jgi:hypothetical protein
MLTVARVQAAYVGNYNRTASAVDLAFPDGGYVGVGRGVVIVARNGNRAAASAGAAAVNGAVLPVKL